MRTVRVLLLVAALWLKETVRVAVASLELCTGRKKRMARRCGEGISKPSAAASTTLRSVRCVRVGYRTVAGSELSGEDETWSG
jgi:hypothetical protein